jgi:hypothetical protein
MIVVRPPLRCHDFAMAAKTGFDALMREVCENWCLGQDMGETGNLSDVRRFFPETGTVTADQFVDWVLLASRPDARGPAPIWQRGRIAIREAFVRCMGGEAVDARALRWPGGPEDQPRYLPIPNPDKFTRNLTEEELTAYEERFGADSREWILAKNELARRRRPPRIWSALLGGALLLALMSGVSVYEYRSLRQRAAMPDRPNLCQLAEHRADYAGRVLNVEGYFLASQHGSSVTDPRCGYGMGVTWGHVASPGLNRLTDLAYRYQGYEIMILVQVTGEVRLDRSRSMGGEHPWILDLADARIVRTQPIADADRDRYLTWLEGPSPEPFRPSR